ncbi:helix-turn-helix transcriptional regulator [Couchioplanes caeruleus]|uniref:AAA ATPase-like protein n=1 Tax=Couchioplanes caeruleus TaxID=56438 RepID=A0A3N1GIG4_9ACTN|nr:LuxR family transcriptional regulator [Couchioplanes caeruleus]ROP29901.1 AAA ATPase-like protein [Couchioplanes caeruleus]
MEHWEFVGRADELARLRSVATSESERGLILSGVAGIGKSRLLREAVTGLPTDKWAVFSASATIASSGLPFGGLAQILPPDPPAGLSPAGLLRWAAEALHTAAGDCPIVLAVDDAHLLDPPSAALAHLLVREGATLLATLRTSEPVPPPISALWTEGLVGHAELAPLHTDESQALLTALTGGPVEAGSAQRLGRLGGGNPLLLRELVMAAVRGGELLPAYGFWRWTGRLMLAPSLAELVDARVGSLTAGVRDVLELTSFGEPIGLPLLLRAADPADVEAAEERGLIRVTRDERRRDVSLAHPLYGEVVRRRCPVTRARRLLATLADLVEAVGARRRDDLLRVAVWRLDSGTAQNGALLLDAASQAFARFDIGLACRLASAAHDATTHSPATHDATTHSPATHETATHSPATRKTATYSPATHETATHSPATRETATIHKRAIHKPGARGPGPAVELLATALLFADEPEEALAVLDASPEDGARWATARATVEFFGLGRPEAADALAAARHADPADAARITAVESFIRLQCDQASRARELAVGVLGNPAASDSARGLARCVLAFLAALAGDPDGACELLTTAGADSAAWRRDIPALQYALQMCEGTLASVSLDLPAIDRIVTAEFATLAQIGGFGFGSGWVSLLECRAAWLAGRTDEALRAVEQACAALAMTRVYDGCAHFARALIAAQRGDHALARSSLEIADSGAGHATGLYYAWRQQARAWTHACAGDPATAVRLLLDVAARLRTAGFRAVELLVLYDLVRLGSPELAAARMAELAASVGGRATPLLVRHACAGTEGEAHLAVAREFSVLGYQVFAAEAAARAVQIFRTDRDPRALGASTLLADLLARCETLRTPALLAVQPALTVRERQVAELAAGGVRSREIADRLFLSPRTVENHLQRVYTKLGVSGRNELAPALRLLPQ